MDDGTPAFLFVYGTLRPGQFNYPWIEGAVIDKPIPATVPGRLFAAEHGHYPVADLGGKGLIHGDLLPVDTESADFQATCRMEESAGYIPHRITATTTDGRSVEAFAYHYGEMAPAFWIQSGDWLERAN